MNTPQLLLRVFVAVAFIHNVAGISATQGTPFQICETVMLKISAEKDYYAASRAAIEEIMFRIAEACNSISASKEPIVGS